MKLKNLAGQTFGKLTVLCRVPNENNRATWYCRCACGGLKVTDSKALRTGKTASCGCLRVSHGMSKTCPLYRLWTSMRGRCNNPNDQSYAYYGRRGIKVCSRWDSFELFVADMGPRPFGTSIERRNNDGDYEPDNCYWATPVEQASNTSRTRLLTAGGRTQTMSTWARELGLDPASLVGRLARGWTEEEACLTPRKRA